MREWGDKNDVCERYREKIEMRRREGERERERGETKEDLDGELLLLLLLLLLPRQDVYLLGPTHLCCLSRMQQLNWSLTNLTLLRSTAPFTGYQYCPHPFQNTSTCVPGYKRIGSSLHPGHGQTFHHNPSTPLYIRQSTCCSLTGT
ncbi:unnamed protein product [Pleuronectes platessa]|uniref:Uncharacterized protein n=1 Tax=Pleuronectes platessa TaxID=8262 RepID=A0A9N7V7A3_PLEPL|nr:unnamed protein product [Pleuronectes platessa]